MILWGWGKRVGSEAALVGESIVSSSKFNPNYPFHIRSATDLISESIRRYNLGFYTDNNLNNR